MTFAPLCRRLAASAGLLFAASAAAAPVGFDNTFGTNGRVYENLFFGTSDDIAHAVAMQPDGAMVVAGTCNGNFCLARFLADGSLDPAFGRGGKLDTPVGVGEDVARAVTLDGTKIVVAGSCTQGGETNFCVARYLANGALDTTFNGSGTVITAVGLLDDEAHAVAMDGTAIVVAGECEVAGATDSCLVRYLANGALDTSFGSGGKVIIPLAASNDGIRGLAINAGKAIVAARCLVGEGNFCVARLNADGTLDSSFGASGKVVTLLTPYDGVQRFDNPNALALLPDGRIAVAGSCRDQVFVTHMCMLVLNTDGTRSTAINGNGQVILTVPATSEAAATGVASVSVNTTYLSGPCTVSGVQRFCVAAITGLGTNSSTFNGGQPLVDAFNGSVDAVPSAIAAVINGIGNTEISVVGSCGPAFAHDFCAARYLQTSARVTSFGVLGTKVQELNLGRTFESIEGVVRQPDGKLVAAGTCDGRACIARFNADGTLDTGFATAGVFVGAVGSSQGLGARVALDGTDIVYATAAAAVLKVTRLLANGLPEPTWGGGSGTITPAIPVDMSVTKIAGVAAVGGGAVVIGFTCGVPPVHLGDFCAVKLAANGALDPSFNAAGTTPGLRHESIAGQDVAAAMAMDGSSIVIAGSCRPGFTQGCVMRLTSAGVPDASFNGTGKVSFPLGVDDAEIDAVSISAGTITVGGGCRTDSKEDFCLARLLPNGSLDTSFNGTGMTSLSLGLFASRIGGLVADATGVVAAGTCAKDGTGQDNDICLARFGANGILDADFNGTGSLRSTVGSSIGVGNPSRRVTELIRDGSRFLAAARCSPDGNSSDFCLAAYVQLPASFPGAPFITGVTGGDAQATVSLLPPIDNGGSAITSYTVTCGTQSTSGATSPFTVTGLLNGVSVNCSATATNSAGTGPASDPPLSVTPQKVASVVLTASVNPSSASGTVTFTAAVSGQGPSGMVEFRLPGDVPVPGCDGAFPVQVGVASCTTITFTTPGTYSIVASYLGDTANTAATSNTLSHTVVATFEQLTIVKLGTGTATVTSAPAGIACGATCTAPYATNAAVTLTATPATGTVVASWFNCDSPSGNECTVLMLGNRTVELTLALQQFALTVAKAGAGTGSVSSSQAGIDCGMTCMANLDAGTETTLTASAAAGSVFAGWSGACSGTGTCQLTMDAAKSVTATFNVTPSFLLTVIKAGTGTGTVVSSPAGTIDCGATCSASLVSGTVVQLVATPAAGSTFASWSGACTGSGACSVTVDAAKTVTATFSTIPSFTLTVAKAGTGTGTVVSSPAGTIDCGATCSASLLSGTVVQLVATPAAGSTFASWSGACAGSGACSVTVDAAKTVTATFDTTNPPRLGNISTRGQVLTGNDVMIGGFVIGGSADKTVVVRARGPSLVPFGITNALANPALQLVRSSDQVTIATNDDWGTAGNAAAVTASGFAPGNALEAAILMTLPPGAYTAIVTGAGNGTGVGIVEVFEVDHPETPLANISTRGQVLSGNDVMIGGFVINGDGAQTVVVRARGPSLVPFGITNALANPVLQLVRSSDQVAIATNDDWQSASNAAAITASGFAPSNALESAILITLTPGAYTAIVTGAGGATGVGIVEVFAQ